MRVLVVEDHPKLATAVGTVLRREGMAVDIVFDGNDALAHVAATTYDVVVLDRDLPGVNGDDVCRSLVAGGCDTRVLMLTAAATIDDRVDGLGPRRRRLPGQAVRLPRAGGPHPGAGAKGASNVAADAGARRRAARLDPSGGDPGWAAIGAPSKGVRRLGTPPRCRGCRGIGRGDPRSGVGRGGRPFHQFGPNDGQSSSGQARRPAAYRDRFSCGLPDRASPCPSATDLPSWFATSAPTDHRARTPHPPLRRPVSRLGWCTARRDLRSRRTQLSDCESKVHSAWCWIHFWRTYQPRRAGIIAHQSVRLSCARLRAAQHRPPPPPRRLPDRARHHGRRSPSRSVGSSQGGFCAHYGRSPQLHGRSPKTTSTSGSHRKDPTTSSRT